MSDNIVKSPVLVPSNFVGVCIGSGLKTPDTFTHSLVRSWDYNGPSGTSTCVATFINPSVGVYNWGTFDWLFDNNRQKQIIFVLGAPPDYLVSRAATGGAYKGVKGNMCPDDLTTWAEVVTNIVSRAKNVYGRTGLIWQLWNEIDQVSSFNDSVALLGPYTRVTVSAIKAVDPTAICIGPCIAGSFGNNTTLLKNYLTSSDGAGGQAKDWIQGVGLHFYVQNLAQASQTDNTISFVNNYNLTKGMLAANNIPMPIYITETGSLLTNVSGGKACARRLIVAAAVGAKCCLCYNYDSPYHGISGYLTDFNSAANILKTDSVITECYIGSSAVEVKIDGVTYTI